MFLTYDRNILNKLLKSSGRSRAPPLRKKTVRFFVGSALAADRGRPQGSPLQKNIVGVDAYIDPRADVGIRPYEECGSSRTPTPTKKERPEGLSFLFR